MAYDTPHVCVIVRLSERSIIWWPPWVLRRSPSYIVLWAPLSCTRVNHDRLVHSWIEWFASFTEALLDRVNLNCILGSGCTMAGLLLFFVSTKALPWGRSSLLVLHSSSVLLSTIERSIRAWWGWGSDLLRWCRKEHRLTDWDRRRLKMHLSLL